MSSSQYKMAMECLEEYANDSGEYTEDMLELLDLIQNYVDRLEDIIRRQNKIEEGPLISDSNIAGWN
uniref:Uncharacterized protein n=1 Tax=viral metagenome TaxID=1070528 RepID=A0A6C0JU73_9ZZZZ